MVWIDRPQWQELSLSVRCERNGSDGERIQVVHKMRMHEIYCHLSYTLPTSILIAKSNYITLAYSTLANWLITPDDDVENGKCLECGMCTDDVRIVLKWKKRISSIRQQRITHTRQIKERLFLKSPNTFDHTLKFLVHCQESAWDICLISLW